MSWCTKTIVGCSTASSVGVNCGSADAVIGVSAIALQRVNCKGGATRWHKPTPATKTVLVAPTITQPAKRVGVRAKMKK
jgi:hypothetical protein